MAATRRKFVLDPRRSLRARFAWTLGLAGLGFAIASSLYIERHERSEAEQAVGHLARREAQLLSRTLRHELVERLSTLREVAGRPSLASGLADAGELRLALEALRQNQPEFAWLGIANLEGRVIAGTSALRLDESVTADAWFLEGRRGPWIGRRSDGGPVAAAFPATRDGQRPAFIDLAVPMHDAQGRLFAVLGGLLRWEWLADAHAAMADEPARPIGLESLVAEPDGRVVIGPGSLLGTQLSGAPLARLLREGGSATLAWPDGRDYLTAAALPIAPDAARDGHGLAANGGRLVTLVRQPAELAFASAALLQQQLLVAGLIATGSFALLSILLAGRALVPLRTLAEAVRRRSGADGGSFAGFDDDTAARPDEIGELARALQRMDVELAARERAQQTAAAALAQSEARFQLALRGADAGLWEWDLATDRLYHSPTWAALLGVPEHSAPDAAPGWSAHVHAEDRSVVIAALGDLATGRRERVEGEVRVPLPQHERRLLVRAFLVRDAEGRPSRVIGTGIDITDRYRTQLQLREREALLQTTSRIAQIGGILLDLVSGEARWTDEAARIHDLPPGPIPPDIVGLGCFHGEHRARLAAAVERARRDGVPYDLELELTTPRTRKWVRMIGLPERDGERVVRIVRVVQDVTARHQAQAEIERLNAELEQRVIDRTAQLRAANAELDSFAYAVSHDLRAPLRAMSGFSQALLEDYGEKLDGEAKLYLDQIIQASRRMADLIDGLLTLSRSTRGEQRRDDVDLSALAERCFAELQRGEPGRVLHWDVEPGLRAQGDARMIDVVMHNLIGNAWKYTGRAATPHVRVGTEWHDGVRWIVVEDNGAGFDMAHAARLFKAFQRLHRQDEFPGIGIGLATVQRIVHRHGGQIVAEGMPGRGARFRFTLQPPPDALPAPEPTDAERPPQPAGEPA